MMYSLLTACVFFLSLLMSETRVISCVKRSSCSCETSEGVIDLRPLGNQNGVPRFQNIVEFSGLFNYSWNPCFTFNDHCHNVAVCQYDILKKESHSLGSQDNVEFVTSGNSVMIEYSADTDVLRTVDIKLVCDHQVEGVLQFLSESPVTFYHFQLTSKYACPVKAASFLDEERYLSPHTHSDKKGRQTQLMILPPSVESYHIRTTTVVLCSILITSMFLVIFSLLGLGVLISRYQSLKAEEFNLRKLFFKNQIFENDMDFFTDAS